MAKFNFRLQGVLNIKQKLEDQEKIAYGLARAKLNEEEEKLQALIDRRDALFSYKQSLMNGQIDFTELNITQHAIDGNAAAIESQKKAVIRATKAMEAAQQRLEKAMKERKTYEKLRENAYEQFLQEMNYEEQLEINELVSFRHGNGDNV
ncbi:MAG: flagellar export protein FliJ [Lachnospiraceae bacterium]|nr:flagellar export protein FliJ [Lachnospiraceae bacterium]MBP5250704.1 flagellar export protein FliJ [Lachnospiraceae bacterium]